VARGRGVFERLPERVARMLERGVAGEVSETPKPSDPGLARVRNVLIGTNRLALLAAREEAEALGFDARVASSALVGEAREAARALLDKGRRAAASRTASSRPVCLLAGGETTVAVRGRGLGGRNQELALAFLEALARAPEGAEDLLLLSASTDGSDGPTDAAGAFASAQVLAAGRRAGLDEQAHLGENDSYHYFDAVGALLRTGPTNTNVCDLQILLVGGR